MSWLYFNYESDQKLACSCCEHQGMDSDFMRKLDRIRADCGFPFVISSGYRCPEYNQQVSSTGPAGPHTTGRAVDIACSSSRHRLEIVRAARVEGITRIGIANNFVHIDDLGAPAFPDNVMWVYS